MFPSTIFFLALFGSIVLVSADEATVPTGSIRSSSLSAGMFPLSAVRLLDSPVTEAVKTNRTYLLALDPDRLLVPFLREAGLEPRAKSYGNWEGGGLGGHTAGHSFSALGNMIASGNCYIGGVEMGSFRSFYSE